MADWVLKLCMTTSKQVQLQDLRISPVPLGAHLICSYYKVRLCSSLVLRSVRTLINRRNQVIPAEMTQSCAGLNSTALDVESYLESSDRCLSYGARLQINTRSRSEVGVSTVTSRRSTLINPSGTLRI